MQARSNNGTIPARQLVREVKFATDTPALIFVLAGDRFLLQSVLRVLNPTPGDDADFIEEVNQACRQENISLPDLKRRLEPAAAALGLSNKSDDRSRDFYDVLNIPSNAPDALIRKAYRGRARELHPDTNPGADAVDFVRLTEAYRVLSNPKLREQYDARRHKTLYWVEKDYARGKVDGGKILMRRQRRRTMYQLAGVVVFLLAVIVVADFFFKEQALKEGPRPTRPPVRVETSIQPVFPEKAPALDGKTDAPAPGYGQPKMEPSAAVLQEVKKVRAGIEAADKAVERVQQAVDPMVVEKQPEPAKPLVVIPVQAALPEKPAAPDREPKRVEKQPDNPEPRVEPPVKVVSAPPPPPPSKETKKPEPAKTPAIVEPATPVFQKTQTRTVSAAAESFPEKEDPAPIQSPPASIAPEPQEPAFHSLERIETFLAAYCGAYQDLNYDLFMRYFTADALENDQAVKDLEPRYRQNFSSLRDLAYHIDVDHVVVQDDVIEVSGDYALRWRFKNSDWRKREGPIFLSLVQIDEGYRVKRLVYQ
jgi:hypothetical protein